MAARPGEPDFPPPASGTEARAALSQPPAVPEPLPAEPDWAALLPPDPDPDWASTDRVWVEFIPILIDPAAPGPCGGLPAAGAAGRWDDPPEDDEGWPDDDWGREPEPDQGVAPGPWALLPAETASPVRPFEMG